MQAAQRRDNQVVDERCLISASKPIYVGRGLGVLGVSWVLEHFLLPCSVLPREHELMRAFLRLNPRQSRMVESAGYQAPRCAVAMTTVCAGGSISEAEMMASSRI